MAGVAVKTTARVAAALGLTAMLLLILQSGLGDVSRAFFSVGWGILGIPVLHLVVIAIVARAWRSVTAAGWPGTTAAYMWARLVRDGVNDLLPAAFIGGSFVGVRVLRVHGAPAGVATAGILVDVTLEVVSQFVFTLTAVALLIAAFGPRQNLVVLALIGALIAGAVLVAFVVAQRWGLFNWLEHWLEKLALHLNWDSVGAYANLHEQVHTLYRQHAAIRNGLLLHLLGWFFTALETWLALSLMGQTAGLAVAVILEGLGQALRSAVFVVPGGLGVQEGGYLALGSLFGIAPETALALSLIRRTREILLGVPALYSWHRLEAGSASGVTAPEKRAG